MFDGLLIEEPGGVISDGLIIEESGMLLFSCLHFHTLTRSLTSFHPSYFSGAKPGAITGLSYPGKVQCCRTSIVVCNAALPFPSLSS